MMPIGPKCCPTHSTTHKAPSDEGGLAERLAHADFAGAVIVHPLTEIAAYTYTPCPRVLVQVVCARSNAPDLQCGD